MLFVGSLATFKTLGRIGWAILIIGFIYIYYIKIGKFRLILTTVSSILFALISFNLVDTKFDNLKTSVYYLKLTGSTKHKQNYSDLDLNTLSSGRGDLFIYSIENFNSQDFFNQFLGYGKKKSGDLMFERRGAYLTAHNRFLEILEFSGYIGFFFFFLFIKKLKNYIFLKKSFHKLKLLNYFFFVYIFSMIASHGLSLYSELLFAVLIAYNINKNRQIYEISELVSNRN